MAWSIDTAVPGRWHRNRLILESSLDQDGVTWLANKRGYGPPEPLRVDRHRIGLLVSKSGSAAVFAQATETLAQLAVDEINADGGIGGVPMELLVGDDASDSLAGSGAARRLLHSGCRIIFACVTSATFNAAASALQNTDVLLVHTVLNEGGRPAPGIVRLGERPLAQARVGVPALMTETGSSAWFPWDTATRGPTVRIGQRAEWWRRTTVRSSATSIASGFHGLFFHYCRYRRLRGGVDLVVSRRT